MKVFSNPAAKLKSKFGEYSIAVLGNIFAVSAQGSASKSAIERYHSDVIDVITQFDGKPWAFLGFLHGPALLTKDAELALQHSIEWRSSKGMVVSALVTGETTIESLVKSQFERVYRQTGVPLGIFKDEQSALAWLKKRGFSATP